MTVHQMIINGLTIKGEPPFGLVYLGRSGIVGAYSFHFNSPHSYGFPLFETLGGHVFQEVRDIVNVR